MEAPSTSGSLSYHCPRNIGLHVIKRQTRLPDTYNRLKDKKQMQDFMVNRLCVRSRLQLSQEGCTFALKFASQNSSASLPSTAVQGEEYCLVTHGATVQLWEMSQVYTHRKKGALHGAKIVLNMENHTDVISCCEWMPTQYGERFDLGNPSLETSSSGHPVSSQRTVHIPPFFSAGFDKVIRMYKGETCIASLSEHQDWVRFMATNPEGTRLLSGSVNSNIFGWDTNLCLPAWRIIEAHVAPPHLRDSLQGINSINGLEWAHSASHIFASGSGDGSVKLWDTRILDKVSDGSNCIGTILAHDGKLNNLKWLQDDRFLLTSGRDDVIRLLDVRMLHDIWSQSNPSRDSKGPVNRDSMVIREYTGHVCSGYNVQASLWHNDDYIVTGSRDGKIHIFDTASGRMVNVLTGPTQPTHLVVPLPERCGPGLMSATAVSAHVFVWAPFSTSEHTPEADLLPQEPGDDESAVEMARQEALENTIAQFGERFLRTIRQAAPANRVFFDEDVRVAYHGHIRDSLRRRGREHLLNGLPGFRFQRQPNHAPEPET